MTNFREFLVARRANHFKATGKAVSEADIAAAERSLGVELPPTYKEFMRTCGSGSWCGDWVPHPGALYPFDESVWEMKGFVSLVDHVRGGGNYLAINPQNPEAAGERPIYLCSHDPFGYARVADTFEQWVRERAAAAANKGDFYDRFDEPLFAKWNEYQATLPKIAKKWWEFWR